MQKPIAEIGKSTLNHSDIEPDEFLSAKAHLFKTALTAKDCTMNTQPSTPLEFRRISQDFAVSGQIWPEQVADIAAAGFKAIICNRPDEEAPDQPAFAALEAAAKEAGLSFYNIPVSPAGMTYENVDQTKAALAEVSGPVFAYCRSGARSTNLWQFVQQQNES